jgi:hypothetical protein
MARLLVEESPQVLREIPLKPGLNRVGRAEDNDLQINDDSVSGHHCEIELNEGVITVRDLGSTNGTFLDGQPIQEAVLQPGQVLRLGMVRMVCQDGPVREPAEVSAPPPPLARAIPQAAAPTAGNAEVCARHPDTAAKWRCVHCGMILCPACVKTTRSGLRDFRTCPQCGSSCVSIAEYARLTAPPVTNFFAVWPGAFLYPLKKDGIILLVCGTILFGFLDGSRSLLSHFRFLGIFILMAYLIAWVMSVGYLFAFMQNIVQSSAQGEEAMPDWPEITSFGDSFAMPFFRFSLIWVLCLAPGIAAMVFVSPFAGVPLLLLGLFCLPMAILTVSLADSLAGLNPIIIFSGIGKVPLPYLTVCGIFLVVIALVHGSRTLLELTGVPFLPIIVSTFLSLYGLAVEMRLLGLLYFTNKTKLAWFE